MIEKRVFPTVEIPALNSKVNFCPAFLIHNLSIKSFQKNKHLTLENELSK